MNAKTETGTSGADLLKWLIAAALVVAGLYGFYYYAEQVLAPVRVLGLLAALGAAAWVSSSTATGRRFTQFMAAANVERRKVVWPTRPETVQTTIAVIIVVIIVGIMIWVMDWVFAKLVAWLVG